MARNVFPSDRVSHLWAHGVQDSAQNSTRSFYFTGPTLYSYGSHFAIAHRMRGAEYGDMNGLILWNDDTYGNTTSKHQCIAWRAMTNQQCNTALHVPTLNQDVARAIDRAVREKAVPAYADVLLAAIRSEIQSIIGKRHASGPFNAAIHTARMYERTAMAFYAHAKRKYPLPMLPESNDDIPADKQGRAAFVLTYSRAAIQGDYAKALDKAKRCLAQSQDAMQNPDASIYGWNTIAATYDVAQSCERIALVAQGHYATLHAGKKSRAVQTILRAIAPMIVEFAARKAAAEKRDALARLDSYVNRYFHHRRQDRAGVLNNLPGYVDQMRDAVRQCELPADDIRSIVVARMLRMDAASCAKRAARSVADSLNGAASYESKFPGDAKRCYVQALDRIRDVQRYAPSMAKFLLPDMQAHISHAMNRLQSIDAEIQAANAERIAAWINGTSNMRPPYEAGTYARIVGDHIETNRGAVVPITHACRLARVFDRIVSAGGKQWADGAGPAVGHYRVNSIGADGSLVIGCHAFNATEARRLRDLLQSCAECAEETALS